MLEGLTTFFKKIFKSEKNTSESSKDAAKERLHLVLMQDRANVSADFLDLMKQEIIDVIKKYIVVDEKEIDVRLTNQSNEDGTNGAPALYANIPIVNIKNDAKSEKIVESTPVSEEKDKVESIEEVVEENKEIVTEEDQEKIIEKAEQIIEVTNNEEKDENQGELEN